jgi:hypothetical protein
MNVESEEDGVGGGNPIRTNRITFPEDVEGDIVVEEFPETMTAAVEGNIMDLFAAVVENMIDDHHLWKLDIHQNLFMNHQEPTLLLHMILDEIIPLILLLQKHLQRDIMMIIDEEAMNQENFPLLCCQPLLRIYLRRQEWNQGGPLTTEYLLRERIRSIGDHILLDQETKGMIMLDCRLQRDFLLRHEIHGLWMKVTF